MNPTAEYLDWNDRLLQFCMERGAESGGRFSLTVHEFLDEESNPDARTQFVDAVGDAYRKLAQTSQNPVGRLVAAKRPDGSPATVAFLGLSVIAAEEMRDLEYYRHLAALLREDQEGSSVRFFVHESFEVAWIRLVRWLGSQGLTAERPLRGKRYIAWPKMHVLLRAVDLEKLPRFFRFARISPTKRIFREEVASKFSTWLGGGAHGLTEPALQAWNDGARQPGVLNQILGVLERWDPGDDTDTFRPAAAVRRSPAVLAVDIVHNRPTVSFRARRPDGFPETISFAGAVLSSSGGDYYQDLPVGPSLAKAVEVGVETHHERCRVTWKGGTVFAFATAKYAAGYESAGALQFRVNGAVLCVSGLASRVESYLKAITDIEPDKLPLDGVLPGWVLFHRFRPVRALHPPRGLEALSVETKVAVRPVGGIRMGQRQEWMEGAPPRRIQLTGENLPRDVRINDNAYPLDADGGLSTGAIFAAPGRYEVSAGAERFSLLIATPTVRFRESTQTEPAPDEEDMVQAPAVALPMDLGGDSFEGGSWTYVGSVAGSVLPLRGAQGIAQWAVGKISGRPAAVALRRRPALPRTAPGATAGARRAWADAILAAAGGRLGYVEAGADPDEIRYLWAAYVCRAMEVKARARRASRDREASWL